MPNIEIADICCKSLFRRLRFAPRKALSWSLSDKMIRQYTGLQLATAWLIDHHEINDISIFEQIADIALKKVADPNVNLAFPAVNYLKQAMTNFLSIFCRIQKTHSRTMSYTVTYSMN